MLAYQTEEQIKYAIHSAIENQDIMGANIMVLKGGKEIFYWEDGFADREANQPIKRDTIFRMYSMSKPITATAALILVERGIIDLYEPVSRYLKGFQNQMVEQEGKLVPVEREIFIKDLLNMTSGLVYDGDDCLAGKETMALFEEINRHLADNDAISTVKAMNRLGGFPLAYQPGKSWRYGTSADVLGAVIEVASGMRFGEFLQKEIFDPLKMEDTGFFVPQEKQRRLAAVYEEREKHELLRYEKDHLAIQNRMKKPPAFESGGAGLVSTITDYAIFTQMLLNNGKLRGAQILRPRTAEFMIEGHLNKIQQEAFDTWMGLDGHSYANLMRIAVDFGKMGTIGKVGEYGWDGWLGCYFTNCPKEQITLLFMTQKVNHGTSHLTRKLRNVILSSC